MDETESLIERFLTAEQDGTVLKPITIWVPEETKAAFHRLQKKSGRKRSFARLISQVIQATIDRTESRAAG